MKMTFIAVGVFCYFLGECIQLGCLMGYSYMYKCKTREEVYKPNIVYLHACTNVCVHVATEHYNGSLYTGHSFFYVNYFTYNGK